MHSLRLYVVAVFASSEQNAIPRPTNRTNITVYHVNQVSSPPVLHRRGYPSHPHILTGAELPNTADTVVPRFPNVAALPSFTH